MTTQNKFPFSTPGLRTELKHTFWLLNRVDSARALAKKLQAHPVFRDYEAVSYTHLMLSKSEINNLSVFIFVDKNICWSDISVQYIMLFEIFKS